MLRPADLVTDPNDPNNLHASTLAHEWSTTYPGQVLCLEVRRDALVERWTPFEEMKVVDAKCERVARVLAPALQFCALAGRRTSLRR